MESTVCNQSSARSRLFSAASDGRRPRLGPGLRPSRRPGQGAGGAGIAELGYQLPEVLARPWLGAGVKIASGGDERGDHHIFFDMLPTNHLYYGFADQFASQNLLDVFGQLMLAPHEKVVINLMAHHFRLVDSEDGQYFGSGDVHPALTTSLAKLSGTLRQTPPEPIRPRPPGACRARGCGSAARASR